MSSKEHLRTAIHTALRLLTPDEFLTLVIDEVWDYVEQNEERKPVQANRIAELGMALIATKERLR